MKGNQNDDLYCLNYGNSNKLTTMFTLMFLVSHRFIFQPIILIYMLCTETITAHLGNVGILSKLGPHLENKC